MIDDNRLGMSLIFRLSNSFDYLDNISTRIKVNRSLRILCRRKILLPIKKTLAQMEISKQKLMNRNMLIEAAKLGDEAAIDTLSTDDLNYIHHFKYKNTK